VWDKKYRPLRFADVLGQQGTIAVLKARLKDGSAWNTSYLFSGGHGMGKTTLGRIMARAMLCLRLNPDDPEPCNECDNCKAFLEDSSQAFQERDAASQGKIEHIRAIVDELPFAVLDAPKRIYLFDECHRMSKDAQDVLLKPIEEKAMVGIFCTTEPEKVRGPIKSRCEEHMARRATREEILEWVKRVVLEKEGVGYEDDGVLTVIDHEEGHLRDILKQLETISQGGDITLERVRDRLNLSLVSVYYEILLRIPSDLSSALALLDKIRERVTAEEAASGLAEAAMNSFRQANGMSADFSFMDRDLASQVNSVYGAQTILVAQRFLRSRYITYIGLTCDIATLSSELRGGVVSAPVQAVQAILAPVMAPAPVAQPLAPPPAATVAPPPPSSPAPAPQPQAAPPPPSVAPAEPSKPKVDPYKVPFIPSSVVGDKAVALTDLDSAVVNRTGSKPKNTAENFNPDRSGRDGLTPIAPEVWRQSFLGRVGVGGIGRG